MPSVRWNMRRAVLIRGFEDRVKKVTAQSKANLKGKPQLTVVAARASKRAEDDGNFPVAGVGASAGGLEAFTELLKALPPNLGMAFVLVPHLDPTHESSMAELLGRTTSMPVEEAQNGTRVMRDHVYVIPPNREMKIVNGALRLAPRGSYPQRMPVDVFLRSLAEDKQDNAIGVILSGTASDGTLGVTAIKAAGGITFAQDSKSAK